jgi:CheY-like chemotaxis protein
MLPALLLTQISDTDLQADDSRLGYGRLLHKPVKPAQLQDALTELLQKTGTRTTVVPSSLSDDKLGEHYPLRILLAEDNLLNQKVALRLLMRMGYEAEVALNGAQAVHAVTSRSYDVILMDVQMPEMDGLEATRAIRTHPSLREAQPYIIAMTAAAMELDREMCLQAGMDDFVSKPTTLNDLINAFKRYLAQRDGNPRG